LEQVWCDFLGEVSDVSKDFSNFKSSQLLKSLPSSIDMCLKQIGIWNVKSVTLAVSSEDSSLMNPQT